MRESIKTGISFGITSGIITTLGIMIGLNAATNLKLAVIGGILTVAIADAFSDALGIHIAEESSKRNGKKAIWEATASTFFTKLIVALSFLIPILIFNLATAIIVNIAWGLLLIIIFNYVLAKQRKEKPLTVISEHLAIAVIVIAITFYLGKFIAIYFA
jgi:VIT1/CCC1 family predicted Fe2+/Mn2+ transporter